MSIREMNIEINIHDLMNPPNEDFSSNVLINIHDTIPLIKMIHEPSSNNESNYLVHISNPALLGFTSKEQYNLQKDLEDFILAMNLNLLRACVTRKNTIIKPVEYTTDTKQDVSHVTKSNENVDIHIFQTIDITDHVSVGVGTSDSLSEKNLKETFGKLKRFARHIEKKDKRGSNLAMALKHYEIGITELEKLSKFKNLFTSLELITNVDGTDRAGVILDNRVSSITGLKQTIIEDWRQLYVRTKHVQKNNKNLNIIQAGLPKIPEMTLTIRSCLQKLIISELNTI